MDTTFQRWKPHSCQGKFVSFSPCHSLLVPLILNPQTGKISPQFHVMFDNWFTSVASIGGEDVFDPSQWQQLFTNNHYQYIFNDKEPISLSDE